MPDKPGKLMQDLKASLHVAELDKATGAQSGTRAVTRGLVLVARYAVSFEQLARSPFAGADSLDKELVRHSDYGRVIKRSEDFKRGVVVYEVFAQEGSARIPGLDMDG
jgi:hypothetical protein